MLLEVCLILFEFNLCTFILEETNFKNLKTPLFYLNFKITIRYTTDYEIYYL